MIQNYIFCEVAYTAVFYYGMESSHLPLSISLLEQSSNISHNIHVKKWLK